MEEINVSHKNVTSRPETVAISKQKNAARFYHSTRRPTLCCVLCLEFVFKILDLGPSHVELSPIARVRSAGDNWTVP